MNAPSPQLGPSSSWLDRSSTPFTPRAVARSLWAAGVRDRLRGCESKDIDLEVYGVDGDRLRTLL